VSRKSKKRARAKFRPPVKASAPVAVGASTPGTARAVSQARVGGDQAVVRAVEMSLGAQNKMLKGPRGRMIVQSSDPSIPLDRVPYFTTDLVRLGVVVVAMSVLLVAGAFTIPILIK
jgi:6,7-dimethyl-8-ribityllumazine synthase